VDDWVSMVISSSIQVARWWLRCQGDYTSDSHLTVDVDTAGNANGEAVEGKAVRC
jgi:hypothetical protein